MNENPPPPANRDFIRDIVAADLKSSRYHGRVATRFPPEPNGYLHIGHAKSICLNFGIARENVGSCNLRFDDTNPHTEDVSYVEAIQADVRWLGFDWNELRYASGYFEQLYEYALVLIERGKAYVDSQTLDEIREQRGTVIEAGALSPFASRSVADNLDLFARMRAGDFPDGAHVLRARIDMAHPNMVMRDPVLYRIRHAHHYRTGDDWCVYPLYDFAHGLSDAIEGITHSLCTLEFENNRELYDWILDGAGINEPRPHQYEFARLNIDFTVLSKRKLLRLVNEGHVSGWDDPRMPTVSGLRRRGYTPEAIRAFCDMIGVAKSDSRVDIDKLEYSIRDDLNRRVPRVLCVIDPLKVTVTNYPVGQVERLVAPLYPHDVPLEGERELPFTRELYIERADFAESPPRGFRRLSPGAEVRLRYGYFIRCDDVVRNEQGEVIELLCTYDPATRGGDSPDGRKVSGTIHWVSASESIGCEVRLYDRLFRVPNPDDAPEGEDFLSNLNPDSVRIMSAARVEPSVAADAPGSRYQFERQGYFMSDAEDSSPERPVFNRTVTLKDSWGAGPDAGRAEPSSGTPQPRPVDPGPLAVHDPVEAARLKQRVGEEATRYQHYRSQGLREVDADVIAADPDLATFFEATSAAARDADTALVAKWVIHDLRPAAQGAPLGTLRVGGVALARLITLVVEGTIPAHRASAVLGRMLESGESADTVAASMDLTAPGDDELGATIDRILGEHPNELAAYRGGKTALKGFFVGQVMRKTAGKAEPRKVQELLEAKLNGP